MTEAELPEGARRLGYAPSASMLARGCRPHERAVRIESGYIYAIPTGDPVQDRVPTPFPNHFDIPDALLPRFREIVQDWRMERIVAEYRAKGGRDTRNKPTGRMARVILGLPEDGLAPIPVCQQPADFCQDTPDSCQKTRFLPEDGHFSTRSGQIRQNG